MIRFFSDILYVTFWDRLDKEIQDSGTSRPAVTKAAGITPNAISLWRIRQTYPAANVIVKIAQELNTTVEYLVTGEVSAGWLPDDINHIVDDLKKLNQNDRQTVAKVARALVIESVASASGGG